MTNIGDRVSARDLTVPVGTVVDSDGNVYVREVDGWHALIGGIHYIHPLTTRFSGTVTGLVPLTETLAMHKQRFAVTCLAMGHSSGGGGYLTGARHIVESLGLPDPYHEGLRIGSWVSDYVNRDMVPTGAVLLSGATDRAEGHSLFVKDRRVFSHLSGPRTGTANKLLQVVALPADYVAPEWDPPTDDDTEEIRRFRIHAWEAGWQEKQSRSWCGDFESAISVLSLSGEVAEGLRRVNQPTETEAYEGQVCTAALMEAAPVGSVVSEGEGAFTATKQEGGWVSGHGDPFDPTGLHFHEGLVFTVIGAPAPEPEVTGPRFAHGTPVSQELQRSCVEGAVFAYDNANHDRYLWARCPEEHARSRGCVGLTIGHEQVCTSSANVTVVWDGVSPIHETPVRDHWEMAHMPVGTVIGQTRDSSVEPFMTWRKTAPDHWERLSGSGRQGESSGFVTTNLRYVYIPVPGVLAPIGVDPNPDDEVEDNDLF